MKNSDAFYHSMTTEEQGKSPQTAHSPSSLNQLLKKHLANHWQALWLTGEIFEIYRSPAGHQYFTLKDTSASIKCVLFRQKQSMSLKKGQKITVLAQVTLYESRGDLQLNILRAVDAGVGDWEAQLAQLKQKLEAQGLFRNDTKKRIPEWIDRLGIVTSNNGAALHDVLNIIKKRNPLIDIKIYPTQVQGPTAPGQIIEQLQLADTKDHDVILLTRGGGSKEDLWAFNDEFLARTIFQLKTPTISAVGHETDESITDFVADQSCITPSAAAQLLAGDFIQKKQHMKHQQQLLHFLGKTRIQNAQQQIDLNHQQLQQHHPHNTIKRQKEILSQTSKSLAQLIKSNHFQARNQIGQSTRQLHRAVPNTKNQRQTLNQRAQALNWLSHQKLKSKTHEFKQSVSQLNDRSPMTILSHGYSVTLNQDKKNITDSKQVNMGETVETLFKSGRIRAKIIERLDD